MIPRSLLARTVLLIIALLIFGQLAAFQILRLTEREPRAQQAARQIAAVVNLTRSALITAKSEKRPALLREISQREGIRVYTGETRPEPRPRADGRALRVIRDELQHELGAETEVFAARGEGAGLLVSFRIDDDEYWLHVRRAQLEREFPWHWVGWSSFVLLLAIAGGYVIAAHINRPLKHLASAAAKIGKGELAQPIAERGPSEVRMVTRAFNQMNDDIRNLDRERSLLLAGVSHDLRTPLSRLRLSAEMLEADPNLKAGMVHDIEDMDAIIGQFLAFVREGVDEAIVPDGDLNEIARTVCERALRHGKTIKTDLKPLPQVPLRPVAIQRLITNLVDNALSHGAGDVEVHIWRDPAHVYLSVLDRGPDIPEAERARMLEPFTRLDTSRSAGSGLGLAIADRIARLHHGEISLLSRVGGGLEARVKLPLRNV
ncbi:MAG: ATP-binding protein [Pyrinomonadaceae bacterium]